MGRKKVFITRKIPHAGIDLLSSKFDVEINPEDSPLRRDDFLKGIKNVDGVLCLLTDKIDEEVFSAVPKVKGFANYAVGFDNIDLNAAVRHKIPVSNTPGVLTDATADMAWALLFAIARRVVESDSFLRTGNWEGWGPMQFIGGDITGKTLGILGSGRIGTAMALRSKGFRMKVLYQDAYENKVLEDQLAAEKVPFEKLIEESDFISIHLPLTAETRKLFNYETFKAMKKSAYLINTARGPIVDEAALIEALSIGEIAGAALDVFEKEPEIAGVLANLPNVVITPHTASATVITRTNMALKAAQNLIAMLEGRKAPDCLNPEIYSV